MEDRLMDALDARIAEQQAATAHLIEEHSQDLTGKRVREATDLPGSTFPRHGSAARPSAPGAAEFGQSSAAPSASEETPGANLTWRGVSHFTTP
jgi:hypothetical protein